MNCLKTTTGMFAAGLVAFASINTHAQAIVLDNPNFESPDFANLGFPPGVTSEILLATQNATFETPYWLQDGPPPDLGTGFSAFGTFNNVEGVVGQTVFPPITNTINEPADPTDRVGFISVLPNSDVALYQETGQDFQAGKTYTFSIWAGASTTFPASSANPLTDPALLNIAIGYLDGGGAFVSLGGGFDISQFVNDGIDDPNEIKDRFATLDEFEETGEFDLLKPFSVTLVDPVAGDASLLTKKIAVQISVDAVDGGANYFIFDGASLTAVPEPTSIALLGLGGLLAMRRRR